MQMPFLVLHLQCGSSFIDMAEQGHFKGRSYQFDLNSWWAFSKVKEQKAFHAASDGFEAVNVADENHWIF